MRRRNQKTPLQPIGEVLFPLLKKRGMASKIEEKALLKIWPQAVGPQIASQTKPDSFRNGTLFVKTISSVWVQQLHFVKEDILRKLNQLSGKTEIKEIRFIVGHAIVREKEQERAAEENKTVLKKRDKKMIAECTENLADQELSDILKRVMQLEISRRRQRESGKVH
jgi:predicted nucleic acid-binding Zn ribbon protein